MSMIRLREYDDVPMELPEKPLKEWRSKFEGSNLPASDLMHYFHKASPFFFNIEQSADFSKLGNIYSPIIIFHLIMQWKTIFSKSIAIMSQAISRILLSRWEKSVL